MAETKRMTAEQVVSYLLEEDGLDFLRESLTWVVQQLMEAEVSELVGAARGERAPEERLTHRNGYRARSWATRASSSGVQEYNARSPGAQPETAGGAMRIDVHAHYFPQEFVDCIARVVDPAMSEPPRGSDRSCIQTSSLRSRRGRYFDFISCEP